MDEDPDDGPYPPRAGYDPDTGVVEFAAKYDRDGPVFHSVDANRWVAGQATALARVALGEAIAERLGDVGVHAASSSRGTVHVVYRIVYEDADEDVVRSAPTIPHDRAVEVLPSSVNTVLRLGEETYTHSFPITVGYREEVYGEGWQ